MFMLFLSAWVACLQWSFVSVHHALDVACHFDETYDISVNIDGLAMRMADLLTVDDLLMLTHTHS